MSNKNLPIIEIGIIGDTLTGKTSLINKYAGLGFSNEMTSTIGIDFFMIEIKSSKNIKYKLKIFDTAGQENYHSLALNIFKKCKGLILVYSINNKKSFLYVNNEWIKNINDTFDLSKIPVLLVGNKIDLNDERIIREEEGRKIADENKFLFYETSAKTGENVEEIFQTIFETIINDTNFEKDSKIKKKNNIKLDIKINKDNSNDGNKNDNNKNNDGNNTDKNEINNKNRKKKKNYF